jgi:hypothetical protein
VGARLRQPLPLALTRSGSMSSNFAAATHIDTKLVHFEDVDIGQ